MSVRVSAPCRLHFGLFHVPVYRPRQRRSKSAVRRFGGLGLMLDSPRVVVEARRAEDGAAEGNLAARALVFARRVREMTPGFRELDHGFALRADGPPEHVGLGVGTALGLATAWALWAAHFEPVGGARANIMAFAEATGRGERSGIGVHGFSLGGVIVDDGKVGYELPTLGNRIRFPTGWRVVLIRPTVETTWHGESEQSAFGRHRTHDDALATTARLRDIAVSRLIPSVERADFDTFADAVHEFNRVAGEPFAADQGGPYSSMAVTCVIDELLGWGVAGVGQSSWGPTVFAFARDAEEAEYIANRARAWLPSDADVTVTAADNQGARVEVL